MEIIFTLTFDQVELIKRIKVDHPAFNPNDLAKDSFSDALSRFAQLTYAFKRSPDTAMNLIDKWENPD